MATPPQPLSRSCLSLRAANVRCPLQPRTSQIPKFSDPSALPAPLPACVGRLTRPRRMCQQSMSGRAPVLIQSPRYCQHHRARRRRRWWRRRCGGLDAGDGGLRRCLARRRGPARAAPADRSDPPSPWISAHSRIPPHAGLAHTGLHIGYDSLSLTVETTVKNRRLHDTRKTVDYTTRKLVDYMNRRQFRRHLHAQLAGPAAEVVGGAGLLGSRPALAALDDSDRRELPQPRCQLPPAVRGSGSARSVRCTLIHAHQLPQCAKLRVRNACRRSYAGTAPRRASPPKGRPRSTKFARSIEPSAN